MKKGALLFTYIFFFFMYFFGFALMGNANAGLPYSWEKQFEPLDISRYIYTLLTVVLAHFVVFRRYYYKRPRWKLAAALVALLMLFILFRYLLEEVFYRAAFGFGNYNPALSFRYYMIDNVYFGSVIIFIGFVLFLFDEMFRNQRRQQALEEQTRLAELNFLHAQMNPHFLFNSLNNIYSLAQDNNPSTSKAILTLSDMMRYVTYQREEFVTLDKEISYVENLVSIYQLRRDHKQQVQFTIPDDLTKYKIPPLVIIPLIENALKHGDLSDPQNPLIVSVGRKNGQLEILIQNRIGKNQPDAGGGVGIHNLRRRLELLYQPGQYSFTCENEGHTFISTLLIPAKW